MTGNKKIEVIDGMVFIHSDDCGCEDCMTPEQLGEFEAFLMEGDRLEALDQDKAFMVHWERKGENW